MSKQKITADLNSIADRLEGKYQDSYNLTSIADRIEKKQAGNKQDASTKPNKSTATKTDLQTLASTGSKTAANELARDYGDSTYVKGQNIDSTGQQNNFSIPQPISTYKRNPLSIDGINDIVKASREGNFAVPLPEPKKETYPNGLSYVLPTVTTAANRDNTPIVNLPSLTEEQKKEYRNLNLPQQGIISAEDTRKENQLKNLSEAAHQMAYGEGQVGQIFNPLSALGRNFASGVGQTGEGLSNLIKETGGDLSPQNIINTPDAIRQMGKASLGALNTSMNVLPGVAALNTLAPYIDNMTQGLAEKYGANPEKVQSMVNIVTPFIFGKYVGAGSILGKGAKELLDKSGILDGLNKEDKALALDIADQSIFFLTAGVGEKAGEKINERAQNKALENQPLMDNQAIDQYVRKSMNPVNAQVQFENVPDQKKIINPLSAREEQTGFERNERPSTEQSRPENRGGITEKDINRGIIERNTEINKKNAAEEEALSVRQLEQQKAQDRKKAKQDQTLFAELNRQYLNAKRKGKLFDEGSFGEYVDKITSPEVKSKLENLYNDVLTNNKKLRAKSELSLENIAQRKFKTRDINSLTPDKQREVLFDYNQARKQGITNIGQLETVSPKMPKGVEENASTIRGNKEELPKAGEEPKGSGEISGNDIQRPQARGGSASNEELGQERPYIRDESGSNEEEKGGNQREITPGQNIKATPLRDVIEEEKTNEPVSAKNAPTENVQGEKQPEKSFSETEQEAMKRVNPSLYKLAQKSSTADEFIKAVAKSSATSVKNISSENLTEFYNRVEKLAPNEKPSDITAVKTNEGTDKPSNENKSQMPEGKINSVNPTGKVFTEYTPEQRAKAKLSDNITTLDKTSGKSPDETITIYRGAPSTQKEIVPGDFITTNKNLAKDYAGNGIVLEKKVKASDVLDDANEPLGEEYIYRPSKQNIDTRAPEVGAQVKGSGENLNDLNGQKSKVLRQLDLATSDNKIKELQTELNRLDGEILKAQEQQPKREEAFGFKLKDKNGNEYLPIAKEGNQYRAIDKNGKEVIRNVSDPQYPNRSGDAIVRDFNQNDKTIDEAKKDFTQSQLSGKTGELENPQNKPNEQSVEASKTIDNNKTTAFRLFQEGKKDPDIMKALGLKGRSELQQVRDWRGEFEKENEKETSTYREDYKGYTSQNVGYSLANLKGGEYKTKGYSVNVYNPNEFKVKTADGEYHVVTQEIRRNNRNEISKEGQFFTKNKNLADKLVKIKNDNPRNVDDPLYNIYEGFKDYRQGKEFRDYPSETSDKILNNYLDKIYLDKNKNVDGSPLSQPSKIEAGKNENVKLEEQSPRQQLEQQTAPDFNKLMSEGKEQLGKNIEKAKELNKIQEQVNKGEKVLNRIISDDAYNKAKENLRKSLGKLSAGIDPTHFKDLATVGAYHFENGMRKFADWSRKMIEEFGDKVKPYLRKTWNKMEKNIPRIEGGKVDEYGMAHRPSETGAFASDITNKGEVMPEDFYTHPRYYMNSESLADRQSYTALMRVKDRPDATVTIYRASPSSSLNVGDWVTLSREYAKDPAEGSEKVHSFKVKAKDIQFAGDDINEFGFYPENKKSITPPIEDAIDELRKEQKQIQKSGRISDNADWSGFKKSEDFGKYGLSDKQQRSAYYDYLDNKIEALKKEGQSKRIITEDSYIKAKQNIISKLGNLNAGLDPTIIKDLATVGAYHVENGLRTFADWSKKMVDEYGDKIKPHLQDIWDSTKKNFPELFKAASTSSTLKSTFTLGLEKPVGEFAKQDIAPALRESVKGLRRSVDGIKKAFAPASRGDEAQLTASIIRQRAAELAQKKEVAYRSFKDIASHFDKQDANHNLEVIDGAENGKYVGTLDEQLSMRSMQGLLSEKYQDIQNQRGGSEAFIENYFPHIWEDPAKAQEVFTKIYARKPLEGSKSFLKQRKIPTTMEGIEYGLKPVSTNPVDLFLAKNHEMDKYIMAHDIFNDFKGKKLVKFVRMGEKPPPDWRQLNDKIGKVFQYSEGEKGIVYRGNYYMPEQAATILNNYLSPGLSGNPGYQLLRKSGNLMNRVQLGISAFHGLFTTGDAITSKTALGIMKISQGRPLEGLKDIASTPATPITNFIKGDKLLKAYYGKNPELTNTIYDIISKDILRAGGRVRMDSFFKNNAVEGWLKAWRAGNPIGGIIRTPGAIVEGISKPLMEQLVPRQKLGVFFDLAKNINEEAIKKNWTKEVEDKRLQEAWDSVDNRMGQLVYDNLFWNKSLKDLGMASVRSLGWNIGDIRELGGAPVDLIKNIKSAVTGQGFRVTPRMAYAMALPIVTGAIGGITNYLYTGQPPQEMKDYFFPRTGKKSPDGTPERLSLPTYMKDVFAYSTKPITTISHKLHPLASTLIDMLNNQDYYGYEIRNTDDPLVKQVKQEMDYVAQQFEPFSFRGMRQRKESGEPIQSQLQSFVGLNPAPKYLSNTGTQNKIEELYRERFSGGSKPYEQKAVDDAKKDIRTSLRNGDKEEAQNKLQKYTDDGTLNLSSRSTKLLFNQSNTSFDEYAFKRLSNYDKIDLLKDMPGDEFEKYLKLSNSDVLEDAEIKKRAQELNASTKPSLMPSRGNSRTSIRISSRMSRR